MSYPDGWTLAAVAMFVTNMRRSLKRNWRIVNGEAQREQIEAYQNIAAALSPGENDWSEEVCFVTKWNGAGERIPGPGDDWIGVELHSELRQVNSVKDHRRVEWLGAQGLKWPEYEITVKTKGSRLCQTYYFQPEHKDIAMLFKLTWGGVNG